MKCYNSVSALDRKRSLRLLKSMENQANMHEVRGAVSGHPPASISAIVPARNEEAVLAACVGSLAVQPEIVEILVVDDQSTDGTARIARGLAAEISRMRLLQTQEVP